MEGEGGCAKSRKRGLTPLLRSPTHLPNPPIRPLLPPPQRHSRSASSCASLSASGPMPRPGSPGSCAMAAGKAAHQSDQDTSARPPNAARHSSRSSGWCSRRAGPLSACAASSAAALRAGTGGAGWGRQYQPELKQTKPKRAERRQRRKLQAIIRMGKEGEEGAEGTTGRETLPPPHAQTQYNYQPPFADSPPPITPFPPAASTLPPSPPRFPLTAPTPLIYLPRPPHGRLPPPSSVLTRSLLILEPRLSS